MRKSVPGLRHQGAIDHANCDSQTNANGRVADRDANSASNRDAKTNPYAHEFAVFFVG